LNLKKKKIAYDKDLVLVFSDWTNEKPSSVLKTLKRGSDWYNIKKGTSTPLNEVLKRRAFSAQLKFWKQRMESADIADIYYPAFLVNGKPVQNYTDFKPGEKVRLRIINAGASTSFWLTFGGDTPTLVSADGKNIVPVKRNKTFIAIAETYDFIVTIPENGRIEIRATSQDGTGKTSAFLGTGKKLVALDVPKPDKIEMMKKIAKMDMKMGAPALVFNSRKSDPYKMMKKYGMKMSSSKNKKMAGMDMIMKRTSKNLFSKYNYDYLKSPNKTSFSKDIPVKNILLNLTGNMQRYVWSLNGKPLSEADKIKIKSGEVTRITLNNLTMMSHPMHLHGHFFRVINKNGDYSPLKHTVNVGPMQKVTIEFYGNESGDWFFHCHILYHLVGGMARVVSYGTPRDTRLKMYPVSKIIDETNRFYSWSNADIASHMIGFNFTTSNIRNQFNITTEYGWNKNLESEITYERYLQSYFRIFGGVNFENTSKDNLNNITTTAVIGMRYLTPYLFNLDVRIDSKLRPDISLSRSIMIFPRTVIFGYYEYKANFNWSNKLPSGINYQKDITWNSGLEYIISKNISVFGSYDNRFGAGGGFSFRF
jgi:FtsP/CotA-like multicopper oxidase with cupredoxin domain